MSRPLRGYLNLLMADLSLWSCFHHFLDLLRHFVVDFKLWCVKVLRPYPKNTNPKLKPWQLDLVFFSSNFFILDPSLPVAIPSLCYHQAKGWPLTLGASQSSVLNDQELF